MEEEPPANLPPFNSSLRQKFDLAVIQLLSTASVPPHDVLQSMFSKARLHRWVATSL